MTQYRLLAPSIVNNTYCTTGAVVDIDYEPGPQMEPLDEEGRRKLEAFEVSRAELEPDYPNSGWPIIERLWHGSLVRERLRELAQERKR